jgi:uncharacterized membrane protein
VSPFDLKSALLARHAQHIVLIHFPIALFLASVAFDLVAHWTKKTALAAVVYYNLLLAAISSFPVVATGILAWRWQLEGQRLKGVLLAQLVLGITSSILISLVWWLHFRTRRKAGSVLPRYRLPIELVTAVVVGLTAHLGGFLSGVLRCADTPRPSAGSHSPASARGAPARISPSSDAPRQGHARPRHSATEAA